MKLRQLITEETSSTVLLKMATTIDPRLSSLNGYANKSCFGKVAHYLKRNWNATGGFILLFGNPNSDDVTHCCLFSDDGTRIVDTFDGMPKRTEDGIVYVDSQGEHHDLLISMPVSKFLSKYFSFTLPV